ncbi:MAG: 2OG-Fe(II) oxygenase [Proteobacteria bacterium]|nr:2OG-Fe(II) oxygenase [Pseudomonadota bacterium]
MRSDFDERPSQRLTRVDWTQIGHDLDARGNAVIANLLTKIECAELAELYEVDRSFRKTVIMARHGFGRGQYRYFSYPLPDIVQQLRQCFYSYLAPIANRWNDAMGIAAQFPLDFTRYIASCAAAGQSQPTPLLLRYTQGDFNCLHQDLYGEQIFPLQIAIQLNEPGRDFDGGEFVLTEQRPRMQSRVEVVALQHGDAVVFPVHVRPVRGSRGYYRVNMRHGVSRLRRGHRITAGIILHDAK